MSASSRGHGPMSGNGSFSWVKRVMAGLVLASGVLAGCGDDAGGKGGDGDAGASGEEEPPAQIFGQVKLAPIEGLDEFERVDVTLEGVLAGGGGSGNGGSGGQARRATPDSEGFFEFTDVPHGDYRVRVEYEGGLESKTSPSAYQPFSSRITVDRGGTLNLARLELELGWGTVAGTVSFGSDQANGEATVTLRGTGLASTADASRGTYEFQRVPVGHYSLIVEREGFDACEEALTVAYHDQKVNAPLSVASKALSFSPSGDADVVVEGNTWFLQNPEDDRVGVAVSAPFAAEYRVWRVGEPTPEYEDFDSSEALEISGLGEGATAYRFQFRSPCGFESQVFERTFVRDTEPPVINFVALNNGLPASRNRTMRLEVAAKDGFSEQLSMRVGLCDVSESGVEHCVPEIEDAPWFDYVFSQSVTFSDEPGTKRAKVQVRDPNGNTTEVVSADAEYDASPPTDIELSIESITVDDDSEPEDGRIRTNLPLVRIQGTGIWEMKYGFNAGLANTSWQPFQDTFRIEVPGDDGPKTLYFRFRDAAGNETSELVFQFVLDRSGGLTGVFRVPGPVNDHSGIQVALVGTNHSTFTDAEGNWSLEGVRAGSYALLATKQNFRDYRIPVQVVAGETLFVAEESLQEFSANIIGHVTLQGFEGTLQHAGATVSLPDAPHRVATTDSAGNFTLIASPTNYPRGLRIDKPGFESYVRDEPVFLAPESTFNVGDVTLRATHNAISGQVKRAGLEEHAGIQIRLMAETGSANEGLELTATTDANGRYTIADVPLGPYRVVYLDPTSGTRETYRRAGIEIAPGPPLVLPPVVLRDRFIKIEGDAELTRTRDVTLELGATDCLAQQISNDASFSDATWQTPCASPVPWQLTAGDGEKTVYVRFKTAADPENPTEALSDTIRLDGTPEVSSFTHDGGGRTLTAGSVVKFTLTANETASVAEVAIAGYETNITLFDNGTNGDDVAGDHRYKRTYTIGLNKDVKDAAVTAYFTDLAGNQKSVSGPTLTIAFPPNIAGVEVVPSYGAGNVTVKFDTDEPTTATIEWDEMTDGVPDFSHSEALTTLATSHSKTFGDGVLVPSTTYAVRIRAKDAAGNETVSAVYPFSLRPSLPRKVVAIPGIGRVHVRWEIGNLTNVVGFNVYRSTSPSGAPAVKLNTTPVNHEAFLYEDKTVTNGTTYYYLVKSVDADGLESEASNVSGATPRATSDGPTLVKGVLNGTVIWSEIHSPYVLTGTVSIEDAGEEKAFFVVGPGTLVETASNEGILVAGQMVSYGQPSPEPNELAYWIEGVANTGCTTTYGYRLVVGTDDDDDGELDDDEIDPTRTRDVCDSIRPYVFDVRASDCDCGGARCRWLRSSSSYTSGTLVEELCQYRDQGRVVFAQSGTGQETWRDIQISKAAPGGSYDLVNGRYYSGNLFYETVFRRTSSYGVKSEVGAALVRSRFIRTGAGVNTTGQYQAPFSTPTLVADSLFEESGTSSLQYTAMLVTRSKFLVDYSLSVSQYTANPKADTRVTNNVFRGANRGSIYVNGTGVFHDNVVSGANFDANRAAVAGNVFEGMRNVSNVNNDFVTNRVTFEPTMNGTLSGSSSARLIGNLVEHGLPEAYSNSYRVLLSNTAQFRANHVFGDFTRGHAVHVQNAAVVLQKNSFFITEANSAGSGLALLVSPNNNQPDIDASNNYWGTVSTAEIEAGGNPKDITAIHDHYDDGDLVTVSYVNHATQSFPMPWVRSPEYFRRFAPGADIPLQGYAFDEEDAAAAGCNPVSAVDPTKVCPRSGPEYCPASCFLPSSRIAWCKAQDDCNGANQLATGASATITLVEPGIHTIWMMARDSDGQVTSVPWVVEIGE